MQSVLYRKNNDYFLILANFHRYHPVSYLHNIKTFTKRKVGFNHRLNFKISENFAKNNGVSNTP